MLASAFRLQFPPPFSRRSLTTLLLRDSELRSCAISAAPRRSLVLSRSSLRIPAPASTVILTRCFGTSSVALAVPTDSDLQHSRARLSRLLDEAVNDLASGNAEAALEKYRLAQDLNPGASDSTSFYNIGLCHYQLGNVDDAIANWEAALKIDPNQSDVLVNLGNVYVIAKKDPHRALSYIKRALELTPDDGEIAYNYACVLEAVGRVEEAVEHYRTAQKHNVERAAVNLRNAMAKLLKKSKQ